MPALTSASTTLSPSPTVATTGVLPFNEIGRGSVAQVGGKGANLGEMVEARLPVPTGFVVTVEAYQAALRASGASERLETLIESLNVDDSDALARAASEAQQIVRAFEIPAATQAGVEAAYAALCVRKENAPVAVRSSATAEDAPSASFAGMFDSFLMVRGLKDLLARIRDCWASAFGPRVLYYRAKQGLPAALPVAVVVQEMVIADRSGVMFSADPATHDGSRIVIEATRGLAEPIVQGQVTPDRYVLDKATLGLRELQVAAKEFTLLADPATGAPKRMDARDSERVLSDSDLVILGSLAVRAEEHFGAPQDMEFAIDDFAVHLVQTRPITTLKPTLASTQPLGPAPAAVADHGIAQQVSGVRVIARGLGASPGTASGVVRLLANPSDIGSLAPGDVLVAHMTSPDWVPAMRRAAAIVTDSGGMTSHAAIVSRELGVPCVVGTRDATRVLHSGMVVTVDGTAGTISEGGKTTTTRDAVAAPAVSTRHANHEVDRPVTTMVTGTRLLVNLSDPGVAEAVAVRHVDGVGLLRAETMIVEALDGTHPQQMLAEGRRREVARRLADSLARIAKAFHPRPVIYRAMDFRSNEFRGLRGGETFEVQEANPMIGYRGCYRYVKDPALFEVELQALHDVRAQYDNAHLMIPFVRTEWELRACLDLVANSPLRGDRTLERWIMAEVPSVVWRLGDYASLGITAISIGSNDLTQLTLGVDRDNERLAPLYDERDPAVLAAIREIIARARALGMKTSICGQAPSVHAEYAEFLVGCGIDSVSVAPDAIETARTNIARAEQRLLLTRARSG